MKKLLILTLALCSLCIGCHTTNPSGKIIATVGVTVDNSMKGWWLHVAQGRATLDQEAKVKAAWLKYRAAEEVAINTYAAAYAAKDDTTMQQITASLRSIAGDLNLLIATFKQGGQ